MQLSLAVIHCLSDKTGIIYISLVNIIRSHFNTSVRYLSVQSIGSNRLIFMVTLEVFRALKRTILAFFPWKICFLNGLLMLSIFSSLQITNLFLLNFLSSYILNRNSEHCRYSPKAYFLFFHYYFIGILRRFPSSLKLVEVGSVINSCIIILTLPMTNLNAAWPPPL